MVSDNDQKNLPLPPDDGANDWKWTGLEDWSTDAMFQKLRELGVDTDAGRFRQQAAEAGAYEVLSDRWLGQFLPELRGTFWEDFPWMSVQAMWPRLASDVVVPDLVEWHLYKAEEAREGGKPLPPVDGKPAVLAAGMELVRLIQASAPANRPALFAAVNKEGGFYDYLWLLSDLVEESAQTHPADAAALADVLCECAKPGDTSQVCLASALLRLGRPDEARRRLEAGLAHEPRGHHAYWIRTRAGNTYQALGDLDAAVTCWKKALSSEMDSQSWEETANRLKKVLGDAGRGEEAAEILRAHPKPPPRPRRAWDEEEDDLEYDDEGPYLPPPVKAWEEPVPVAPLKAAPKVGRNDPCPCGSGKKYKKCCMK